MAAASPSELAETASGANERGVGAAADASGETPSGAFDSVETASGAFDSDETVMAPSGAFDAGCDVAIGTHAALWPPSQCARWQRAPQ